MNFTIQDKPRGGTHKMFSRLRKHFTYANVAVTFALLFAMSGGALAASKYLITSTKQISPKVLKSLTGKAGAPGVQGPAGPEGPAGPAGKEGAVGKEGPAGKGERGEKGETGAEGKEGKEGRTGFTKTLPKGETEKGVWFMNYTAAAAGEAGFASISFPISLASQLGDGGCGKGEQPCQLHYIGAEEGEGEQHQNLPEEGGKKLCSGTYEEPRAASGNLCVFVRESENAESTASLPSTGPVYFIAPQLGGFSVIDAAGTAGTLVKLQSTAPGAVKVIGSWAVTAPTS